MTEKKTKQKANQKLDHEAMVQKIQHMSQFVNNVITNIEIDLKRAKVVLNKLSHRDPFDPNTLSDQEEWDKLVNPVGLKSYQDDDGQIIEGVFDGYFMLGNDQKKYPVPLNYASKTKLVPGDILKLKIIQDGKLIYKLIGPVERKHQKAVLSLSEDNKPIAVTQTGETYFLNQAAVTYFKGQAGDELFIMINMEGVGGFAAIEAVIKA